MEQGATRAVSRWFAGSLCCCLALLSFACSNPFDSSNGSAPDDPNGNQDDLSPPPKVVGITPEAGEDNPVIWPGDEDDPVEQTYQLETADSDYDGPLYFRAVAEAELPEWITLDSEIGSVVVSTAGLQGGEDGERTVEFYSSANADAADDDEETSTIAEPFPVTFHREREREE